jgi:hypothetical protein
MSAAAAGLLRALLARVGNSRDRILLTDFRSIEWQSLTFVGERHLLSLRIIGPDCDDIADRLVLGLEDAEFAIPGHIVADIGLVEPPSHEDERAITLSLEALTIAE